jgi:hypothetical protein
MKDNPATREVAPLTRREALLGALMLTLLSGCSSKARPFEEAIDITVDLLHERIDELAEDADEAVRLHALADAILRDAEASLAVSEAASREIHRLATNHGTPGEEIEVRFVRGLEDTALLRRQLLDHQQAIKDELAPHRWSLLVETLNSPERITAALDRRS